MEIANMQLSGPSTAVKKIIPPITSKAKPITGKGKAGNHGSGISLNLKRIIRPEPVVETLCMQLLIQGRIEAYCLFFRLTKDSPNTSPATDEVICDPKCLFSIVSKEAAVSSKIMTDIESDSLTFSTPGYFDNLKDSDLDFFEMQKRLSKNIPYTDENLLRRLKSLLEELDIQYHDSDDEGASKTLRQLGSIFASLHDYPLAYYFYHNAVDRLFNRKSAGREHFEALIDFGAMLASANLLKEALVVLQEANARHVDTEQELRASHNLINVHLQLAETLEQGGFSGVAVEHYNECAALLQKANDGPIAMSDLNYRIGQAHRQNADFRTAIDALGRFVDEAGRNQDTYRQGLGQAALADCWMNLSESKKAAFHLQQFLKNAQNDDSLQHLRAQACEQLGCLYSNNGQYTEAIDYYQKHYAMVLQIAKAEARKGDANKILLRCEPNTSTGTDSRWGKAESETTNLSEFRSTLESGPASPSADSTKTLPAPPSSVSHLKSLSTLDTGNLDTGRQVNNAQCLIGVTLATANFTKFLTMVKDESMLHFLLDWKSRHDISIFAQINDEKSNKESREIDNGTVDTKENIDELVFSNEENAEIGDEELDRMEPEP